LTVLGVDIGNTGAVALIDELGGLVEVHDNAVPRGRAEGLQERQRSAAGGADRPHPSIHRLCRMGWAEAHRWRCAGVRLRAGARGVVEAT
jgi:hypothetical protein